MERLPDGVKRALARARAKRASYAVDVLKAPDGRLVAVLGEAHMKLAEAAEIGKEVVRSFELRGVETFQRKQVVGGQALGIVIQVPRTILRYLSLGAIKGSTITDAKQLPSGHTVELERAKRMPFGLHVTALYMTAYFVVAFLAMLAPLYAPLLPVLAAIVGALAVAFQMHMVMLVPAILLRRFSWCWVIHPFLGILTLRDELMAAGTVRMLEDHPREKVAVVVMGRAHVSGYGRLLVEKYGYSRVDDALEDMLQIQ